MLSCCAVVALLNVACDATPAEEEECIQSAGECLLNLLGNGTFDDTQIIWLTEKYGTIDVVSTNPSDDGSASSGRVTNTDWRGYGTSRGVFQCVEIEANRDYLLQGDSYLSGDMPSGSYLSIAITTYRMERCEGDYIDYDTTWASGTLLDTWEHSSVEFTPHADAITARVELIVGKAEYTDDVSGQFDNILLANP